MISPRERVELFMFCCTAAAVLVLVAAQGFFGQVMTSQTLLIIAES